VIDEDKSESQEDHDTRMKNVRWHLSEGEYLSHVMLLCRLVTFCTPCSIHGNHDLRSSFYLRQHM
jgi:hypothetical protein